jgi:hypothetical protein
MMTNSIWIHTIPSYSLVELFRAYLAVGNGIGFFKMLAYHIERDKTAKGFFTQPPTPDFQLGDVVCAPGGAYYRLHKLPTFSSGIWIVMGNHIHSGKELPSNNCLLGCDELTLIYRQNWSQKDG